MSPRRGSTPRQTDWLTVGRNVTLTLTDGRHSRYQSLLRLQQYNSKPTCSAIAEQRAARLLVQRAPNQYELCRPAKISEALHSPLLQHTGNPAQRSSAGYPLADRRIQPAALRALRHLVAHNRPISGPALPHRLQRSPSASCRSSCISNERGQFWSVTWSCSDIPLVLRDCASTPHWCYVVVSQRVCIPTNELESMLKEAFMAWCKVLTWYGLLSYPRINYRQYLIVERSNKSIGN
jgi:hypothetical protein